jgi:hypothetical protein
MVGGWGIKMAVYQQTILQAVDIKRDYFSFGEIPSPRAPAFPLAGKVSAEPTDGGGAGSARLKD